MAEDPTDTGLESMDSTTAELPKETRFAFKGEKRRTDSEAESRKHYKHRRKSRRYQSSTRQRPSTHHEQSHEDKGTETRGSHRSNAGGEDELDPDRAFRESLFDAMADDEGAEYWAGVYGQPIHNFGRPEQAGEGGELEQMTDEEYATWVRQMMWRKTHQGLLEERARREAAAKAKQGEREQGKRNKEAHQHFQAEMEASLRRSARRREQKLWTIAWDAYGRAWNLIMEAQDRHEAKARHLHVPWPVQTGKLQDIQDDAVVAFFEHAPSVVSGDEQLSAVLKRERIRWHPDKMRQRFGAQSLSEADSKGVTAVFQVVDDMWLRQEKAKATPA